MKIYQIDQYKIHVNKKKKQESPGSIFTVYTRDINSGKQVKIGDGFLRYENEEDILVRLNRLLEEW